MMKMLKQAADMQKNMEKVQACLAENTVEFTSGGGMVKAVARGDLTLESVTIDPKAVDPEDVEMLEDLVLSAVKGALQEAKEMSAAEMGKLTEGLNLPLPGM